MLSLWFMLEFALCSSPALPNLTDAPGSCSLSPWQKYAHVRQAQRGSKPYYTSVMWWCGVTLMGVGELGNFAAYGFAPASLIAPLGCVSVIGNCDLFFFSLYIIHACRQEERVEAIGNNSNHCHVKSIVLLLILSQTGIYVLTLLYMLKVWKLLLFCLTSDKNRNQYRMG